MGALWVGNSFASGNLEWLKKNEISHICSLWSSNDIRNPEFERNGISQRVFIVSDTIHDDFMQHFEKAYQFIDSALAHGNLVVHCHQGISRSGAIVTMYLMKKFQMGMEDSLKMVRQKRPIVSPNKAFMQQLRLWEG